MFHLLWDKRYKKQALTINNVTIHYGSSQITGIGDAPLILDDLTIPFEFELELLQLTEKYAGTHNYSVAGILIKVKRDSLGQLLSGYYYPTASFAMLSMVSFLIHPDVVRETQVSSLALFGITLALKF